MSSPTSDITSVLKETRVFPPPAEFAANAIIKNVAEYELLWNRAKDHPDQFWSEQAEQLRWFQRWSKAPGGNEPHAQWFVGGKLNACYNCVDRHVLEGRKNKAAIIW